MTARRPETGNERPAAADAMLRGATRDEIRFIILVMAALLAVIVGWLLYVGKGLLLPIFAAVISVYVLTTAAEAMRHVPGLRLLPEFARRLLVLLGFIVVVAGLGLMVALTVEELVKVAPGYRSNLERLASDFAALFGQQRRISWEQIRSVTLDRISMQAVIGWLLGSVTNLGGTIFLVVIYAAFLIGERDTFTRKLADAFPHGGAERTARMIGDINRRIGDYLTVKTLVNIIGAVISYVIMLTMGLDFALFWALLIGLLNYIPYVGSLVAVLLPLVLSLAQFGSLGYTLVLAGLLWTAQLISDNVVEPRLVGRQLNLSPFVVLVALSLWSALWGLPGAILAIPMTSMLVIIFAGFPATRFIAVLLSGPGGAGTDADGAPPSA